MPDAILTNTRATTGSGAYNKRITIQTPQDVSDSQGGVTRIWVTVISTWAKIKSWKGIESWQAGQVYPVFWKRVLIRYRSDLDITDTMRILHKNHIYNIRSVDIIEEALTNIEMVCEQLQASGTLS